MKYKEKEGFQTFNKVNVTLKLKSDKDTIATGNLPNNTLDEYRCKQFPKQKGKPNSKSYQREHSSLSNLLHCRELRMVQCI